MDTKEKTRKEIEKIIHQESENQFYIDCDPENADVWDIKRDTYNLLLEYFEYSEQAQKLTRTFERFNKTHAVKDSHMQTKYFQDMLRNCKDITGLYSNDEPWEIVTFNQDHVLDENISVFIFSLENSRYSGQFAIIQRVDYYWSSAPIILEFSEDPDYFIMAITELNLHCDNCDWRPENSGNIVDIVNEYEQLSDSLNCPNCGELLAI